MSKGLTKLPQLGNTESVKKIKALLTVTELASFSGMHVDTKISTLVAIVQNLATHLEQVGSFNAVIYERYQSSKDRCRSLSRRLKRYTGKPARRVVNA